MIILAEYPDAFAVHLMLDMVFSKMRLKDMLSDSLSRTANTYLDALSSPLEYIKTPTPPTVNPRFTHDNAASLYSF